jgi:hypothetical protein
LKNETIGNVIKNTASLLLTTTFTWMLAALAGALLFDTFVLYPNIFSNVPSSLQCSIGFLQAGSPGMFFASAGSIVLIVGITTLVLMRKHESYFKFCLAGFLLIVCGEFLLSVFIFWPLNAIMFSEGLAMHSESELTSVAKQIQDLHSHRLTISFVASAIGMMGFLLLMRKEKQ